MIDMHPARSESQPTGKDRGPVLIGRAVFEVLEQMPNVPPEFRQHIDTVLQDSSAPRTIVPPSEVQ